jgi:alpha-L-fucosidase
MVFYHSPERREHRWIGNESGFAGDPCWATLPGLEEAEAGHKGRTPDWREFLLHGDPDGRLWCPAMVDTVMRNHHWFWRPDTEDSIEPVDRLLSFYCDSVGRNSNLVLGLTPAPDGLLPEPDFRRCEAFGREIRRRFAKPVAATAGTGRMLRLDLPAAARIDHVEVMEDIAHGERVRAYTVEALVGGDDWQVLCTGTSVGHRRLQAFAGTEAKAVRLTVSRAAADPRIRRLAVYAVD